MLLKGCIICGIDIAQLLFAWLTFGKQVYIQGMLLRNKNNSGNSRGKILPREILGKIILLNEDRY
jgi:hypothetical protein